MKRLIAGSRAPHYRGRQLKPGEKFEATPTDAAYFIRHGLATESSAPKPAAAAVDPVDAPPPAQVVEQEEPRQRRAYRRRDMTAETVETFEPVQTPE